MISVKRYKNHLVEKYDREDDTLKDKKEQKQTDDGIHRMSSSPSCSLRIRI